MAPPGTGHPDSETGERSVRVLLVDDDKDFVELASRFLRSELIDSVDGVFSGRAALRKLGEGYYDVIICDYLMPEMDGVQLLKELRSKGIDTPFVLITGRERDELSADVLQSGVDLHVHKSSDIKAQFVELVPIVWNLARCARLKRQLSHERDMYRHIVDLADEGIWSVDGENRVTFANPKMAGMMACSADEMVGRTFSEILPGDGGTFVTEALELCREGTDIEMDYEFQNAAGKRHVVSFKASRMVGPDEEYLGAVAVFINLASRRLVEDALTEALKAREEFEKIVNASPVVVFQLEPLPPWKVEFVSDNVTQFGFTPDEFISGRTTFADVVHPDNLERIQEEVLEHIEAGEDLFDLEYVGLSKAGEARFIDARVFVRRDADGNVLRFQGVILDDTERRKTAHELERLASIVESSTDAIISKDLEGTILTWNPAAETMYGYTAREAVGSPITILVPPDLIDDFQKKFREVKRGRRVVSHETRRVRKDGTLIDVSLTISPLKDRSGRTVGASVIARDIGDRKRAEAALRSANEKLSLMGSITRHDVINQIGILSGYLSLIEDDKDDRSRAEHIQSARKACSTMTEQLQFAGSYQKAGTRNPEWTRARLELAGASSALDMGDIVVTDFFGDLEILVDPMFEKVFLNLLLNTRRHGQKATKVTVGSEELMDGLLISYEDDGVGIPANDKEKIFERGYGRDSGLGLFLIREILAITDIKIVECGTPGDGARFEMTVPRGKYRHGSRPADTGE
ncbi:TPA: PAS domain S-box protein [Thermoplasmata archaeon]|nr:PAS domain S-box protein [Thermoplasmata archaeon]